MTETRLLARGMGASPGEASGVVVFRADHAIEEASRGADVILVRVEACAEDVPGIRVAKGVVSTRGGLTGDAAIVARTLGIPCIVGVHAIVVDYAGDAMTVTLEGERVRLERGARIHIDGTRGLIHIAPSA